MLKSLRSLFSLEKQIKQTQDRKKNTCGHGFRAQLDREIAALIDKRSHARVAALHDIAAHLDEMVERQFKATSSFRLGARQAHERERDKLKVKIIDAFKDVLMQE